MLNVIQSTDTEGRKLLRLKNYDTEGEIIFYRISHTTGLGVGIRMK